MKNYIRTLIAIIALSTSVMAANLNALFVNLTSDAAHEAYMALHLSSMMNKDGHPVTVFLNDKGTMIASKAHSKEYAEAQSELKDLIKNGAQVLVCPMCILEYKVEAKDLLEGIQVANHKKVEAALFAPNTTTLSW